MDAKRYLITYKWMALESGMLYYHILDKSAHPSTTKLKPNYTAPIQSKSAHQFVQYSSSEIHCLPSRQLGDIIRSTAHLLVIPVIFRRFAKARAQRTKSLVLSSGLDLRILCG